MAIRGILGKKKSGYALAARVLILTGKGRLRMSRKKTNLTGQTFGRLTVLRFAEIRKKLACWECQCSCGNKKIISGRDLVRGRTKSCGCFRKEINKTHGLSQTRLFRIWCLIRRRCFKQGTRGYKYYGSRGITICKEWLEFMPFYNWAMSQGYRENLTIERIDNNGNYESSNCTWIPQAQQTQNSRHCVPVVINNLNFHTITAACRHFGVTRAAFYHRLKRGLSAEQALSLN